MSYQPGDTDNPQQGKEPGGKDISLSSVTLLLR
jgi:hypothetical protein